MSKKDKYYDLAWDIQYAIYHLEDIKNGRYYKCGKVESQINDAITELLKFQKMVIKKGRLTW